MRYGSLCSGIEAASVAFGPLGWEAAWFSEIEAFPNAVLAHHYPGVANHGDMTTIRERILSGEIEAPDMICGGPPCQAFSVAGLRRSLDDERGNLTLEYVKICDATDTVRLAAGRPPAWILYENVPGILNTKDNAFGALLGGLCGSDTPIVAPAGWGRSGVVNGPSRTVAYRVLNAEFFGLAQRRKRVFVLAKGGAGRWAAADALLPIIESSRWHPAPRRGKGEGITPCIASGAENSNGAGIGREGDPMFTLDTTSAHAIAHTLRGEGFDASEDGTGRGVPLVPEWPAEIASTLDAHYGDKMGLENQHVNSGCPLFVPFKPPMLVRMREGKEGGGKGPLVSEDQSLTLATGNDQVLAYTIHGTDKTARVASETDLAGCIRTKAPGSIENSSTTVVTSLAMRTREGVVSAELGEPGIANALRGSDGGRAGEGAGAVLNGMQVRRLTPVECARLQGFPDDYLSQVTFRGKCPPADGVMYKALGNSWAVPCARWIGERIKAIRP